MGGWGVMFSKDHMRQVLREARETLAGMDVAEQARRCGLALEQGRVTGASLGETFAVSLSPGDEGESRDPWLEGVALHHLIRAGDGALDGEWVSLFDMPELRTYEPTLKKRVERPLVRAFAGATEYLWRAVAAADGVERRMPGMAATVWFLPRIPITLSVHEGDEEIPPAATVLFDASVRRMLPPEDIVVAAEITAHRLKTIANRIRRHEENSNAKNFAD